MTQRKQLKLSDFPNLLKQFSPKLNSAIDPSSLSVGSHKRIWWKCEKASDHIWQQEVRKRTYGRVGCPFCANRHLSVTNCLVTNFPSIAQEWHSEKNGVLHPLGVLAQSTKRVWWKCNKNPEHEWQTSPRRRTQDGTGCPFCANRVLDKTNSFAHLYPELAKQWHPTKNGSLTPLDLLGASRRKVWWKCENGFDHEWISSADNRSRHPFCPFCVGKRVSVTNSLQTLHPDLSREWHTTKNYPLTPSNVTSGSGKVVWWKCKNGSDHDWKTPVFSRTGGKKTGCPFCSGHKLSTTSSLSARFPELASQWDHERNGKLKPSDVLCGSSKKVWWVCEKDKSHRWKAAIKKRVYDKSGCLFCLSRFVSKTNNLLAVAPNIASQWHSLKNGSLQPADIVAGSQKVVWWKCDVAFDHEWRERVANRVRFNLGCPFCANRKLSVSNSLANRFPDIASELHPTKNNDLTPDRLVYASKRRVWWKCSKAHDHVWQQSANQRTGTKPTGCPFCTNRRLSVSNCLTTVAPDLAKELHPDKNRNLTPQKIIAGSKRKVWWKCRNDPTHEWYASVGARLHNQSSCPWCNLSPRSRQEIYLLFELRQFVDVEIDKHKVKIGGKLLDVDIIVPSLKLIVEFDGSYWHNGKESIDKEKTLKLMSAGYIVIRVREEPLSIISQHDVVVKQGDVFRAVLKVVSKICNIFDLHFETFDQYVESGKLRYKSKADKYIKKLLTLKEKESNNGVE